MATIRISTLTGGDCATSIKNRIDGGAGPGLLKCYDGTVGGMPATPETAITTQVLLGTLPLSDPCGTVSGRTLNFSAITSDTDADADGEVTFCRVVDSNGVAVVDGDASLNSGTGLFKFNTTTVVAGGPIVCTSGALSVG